MEKTFLLKKSVMLAMYVKSVLDIVTLFSCRTKTISWLNPSVPRISYAIPNICPNIIKIIPIVYNYELRKKNKFSCEKKNIYIKYLNNI